MLLGSRVAMLDGYGGCLAGHLDIRQCKVSCFALRKLFLSCVGIMPFLTHFIGITSSIRAQYGIDLPGSLHTNKIPAILGRYPLPRFFCRLNIVPLDMDNGTFNSSHTDVVEKVNFLVVASQHGGTSVAEGSP